MGATISQETANEIGNRKSNFPHSFNLQQHLKDINNERHNRAKECPVDHNKFASKGGEKLRSLQNKLILLITVFSNKFVCGLLPS